MRALRPLLLVAAALGAACSSSSSSSPSPGSSSGDLPDGGGGDSGQEAGPTGTDTGPPADVKTTTESTTFAGETRKYILSVPVDYDASKKYPLILSFHGNPGTAEFMRDVFPIHPVTKREAIVVYPNALGTDWDLFTPSPQNEDMGFVRALLDELGQKYSVDPKRVLGFGWSGGAFFVNQLACRFSGMFRAIASNSGGAPLDVTPGDKSTYAKCTGGPEAIFIVHGTADTEVVFASGQSDAQVWASINGCGTGWTDVPPAPCQKQDGCPASTPVVFCAIEGGQHPVWNQAIQGAWDFLRGLP